MWCQSYKAFDFSIPPDSRVLTVLNGLLASTAGTSKLLSGRNLLLLVNFFPLHRDLYII